MSSSLNPAATGLQATEAGALPWLSSRATLALVRPAARTAKMILLNILIDDVSEIAKLDLR